MRTLYLDGLPEGVKFKKIIRVGGKDQIDSLYEDNFFRLRAPELTLDCRGLPTNSFNQLLKFIEEYSAPIVMLANDPVPSPILSRFSNVIKLYKPKSGSLLALRLSSLSPVLKDKVSLVLGLSLEDG